MYLTADSLIKINNIITSSNNITLRRVNVKLYGFDKMYMGKELIEEWRRGVVLITTAQLHSSNFIQSELRFGAGSNPARGISEIRDGEDI